jgi:hypothetical protein
MPRRMLVTSNVLRRRTKTSESRSESTQGNAEIQETSGYAIQDSTSQSAPLVPVKKRKPSHHLTGSDANLTSVLPRWLHTTRSIPCRHHTPLPLPIAPSTVFPSSAVERPTARPVTHQGGAQTTKEPAELPWLRESVQVVIWAVGHMRVKHFRRESTNRNHRCLRRRSSRQRMENFPPRLFAFDPAPQSGRQSFSSSSQVFSRLPERGIKYVLLRLRGTVGVI